jgi:zinc transporter 9
VAENRERLLSRAVPDELEQRFVALIRARPSIADIHDVKTRQLTPESFPSKAEIRLHVGFVSERVQGLLPPGLAMPSGEPRGCSRFA